MPVQADYSHQRKLYDMQLNHKQCHFALHQHPSDPRAQQYASTCDDEYQLLTPDEKKYYHAYDRILLEHMPERQPVAPLSEGQSASYPYLCRECSNGLIAGEIEDYTAEAFDNVIVRMHNDVYNPTLQIQCLQCLSVWFQDLDANNAYETHDKLENAKTAMHAAVAVFRVHVNDRAVVEAAMHILEMMCVIATDLDDDEFCKSIVSEGTGLVLSVLEKSQYTDHVMCQQGLSILLTLTTTNISNHSGKLHHADNLLNALTQVIRMWNQDHQCILLACKLLRCIYQADNTIQTMLQIEENALPVLIQFCTQNPPHEIHNLTRDMIKIVNSRKRSKGPTR